MEGGRGNLRNYCRKPLVLKVTQESMQQSYKSIRELVRDLQRGERLLSDMFSKRKTVSIRYDDAVETLEGDENRLRSLIAHGVMVDNDGTLELDDNYLSFFENVLEVNEDINVASIQTYIGKLQLSINSFLASDNDKRKAQLMREVRHFFRSIEQMTRRNIVDLKRNVENTYKQEPDFKIKKLRLKDFDEKRRQIASLILQTERLMDEQTVFFSSAMDVGLQLLVKEVRSSLHESSHGLIDIEKQIIDYLNRIEYQSRIVKKLRQLKYLKEQFMLEENTSIRQVLTEHHPVWMEPSSKYFTKVSLDFLRNDDSALDILADVRRSINRKAALRQRLAGRIEDEYLTLSQEQVFAYNHQEIFNAFKAQGADLFSFVMHYELRNNPEREERLVLFLQLASQFPDELRFEGTFQQYHNIEYPIILPL